MKFGCQTYTWQMSAERYAGRIDHILSVVAAAGMRGIEADKAFAYLRHFPGTLLALGQMAGADRTDLRRRQANAISCFNAVGRRAVDRGIVCAFHPNSPAGSVFRTREDYAILLDGLDSDAVGLAPDAGHIAKGGMEAVEMFRSFAPLVRHVHFKDTAADGGWTEMGCGTIDFPAIVAVLREADYDGWIMIEDESPRAEADPDAVTLANGRYVRQCLIS